MSEIILVIIIISLFCNGLYVVTSEGNLLYPVRKWMVELFLYQKFYLGCQYNDPGKLSKFKWIYDPLIGCITCMSSFWGTLIFFYFYDFTPVVLPAYFLSIFGASFLNPVLFSIYDRITKP